MAEVGSAFVSVMPSAKGFGSKLNSQVGPELDRSGKGIGSKFGTAMKVGAAAAVGGALVAGKFLADSIGEAREAQKVTALTNSTIKATGGAAGVTAKHVGNLAAAISLKTGIDDETIQSGQNMLLTFKNIRNEAGKGNDIFDQSTKTLTDMSTAMGTEPKQAAIQLGKALNDPIKGISALSRVGVTFTEQQKKQIEGMVKAGDTAKAQKVILGELNSEFGGAAEAQATAGDKARTAFANLQESVGTALLPLWDKLLEGMTKVAIFLTNNIGPSFRAVNGFIAPVVDAVMSAFGGGGGVSGALSQFAASVRANFLPVLQTMANTFTTVILPAITSLASYLAAKLSPVFQQVWSIIATKVVPIVASLARFLYGTLYPAVVGIVVAVAQRLKPVFDQLVATFKAKVLPAVSQLLTKFREWQPTIQKVIVVVVKIVGWVLKLAASILGKVLPVVIRFAGFLIGVLFGAIIKVIGAVVRIVKFLFDLGGAIVKGVAKVRDFAGALVALEQRGLDTVLSAISNLPGRIIALGGRFLDAGRAIIGKFVDGLQNAGGVISGIAGNVWDALRGMLNSAINQINSAIDFTIHLPGPDIHINPPDIPTLAAGGVISRPTMALVGEGRESEAVMPLSKLSAMLDRERSAATATSGGGVFHLYDADGVLLGSMRGVVKGDRDNTAMRRRAGASG